MNSRRTLIIAAALTLALLAFFGVVYYLSNVEDKAYGDAKLVDVYKVTKEVPKGLQGSAAINQGYIQKDKIPSEFKPGSALNERTINDIASKVALNTLSPGQIVVDGQFVDANVANVGFSQRIPAGQVAVSVSVDQVHGVAGLLVPGDKVNIMVVRKAEGVGETEISTLYQNVDILAIGNRPAPTAGESTARNATGGTPAAAGDAGLITFAVPMDAAQRIALASGESSKHSIYLTLVPPFSSPIDKGSLPSIDGGTLAETAGPTPYPQS